MDLVINRKGEVYRIERRGSEDVVRMELIEEGVREIVGDKVIVREGMVLGVEEYEVRRGVMRVRWREEDGRRLG